MGTGQWQEGGGMSAIPVTCKKCLEYFSDTRSDPILRATGICNNCYMEEEVNTE